MNRREKRRWTATQRLAMATARKPGTDARDADLTVADLEFVTRQCVRVMDTDWNGWSEDEIVASMLELMKNGLVAIQKSIGAGPNGEDGYRLVPTDEFHGRMSVRH